MGEIFLTIKMILQIMKWGKEIIEFAKANKEEKWFQDLTKTFGEINHAINDKQITPEKKTEALKNYGRNLSNLFSKL